MSPARDDTVLEAHGIEAHYGIIQALFGASVSVRSNAVTAVLGPNGAGKTTLLRVLSGLLPPTAGTVTHRGEDIGALGARALARRGVCHIPEGRGIFPNLTVREHLQMQTHLVPDRSLAEVEERAYARFPRLGERRSQIAGTLSGGEQHMLALSRALTTDPQVILIDEISMGLAPVLVDELFTVVRSLADSGQTIVLVEQLADYAMDVADEVYLMNLGRVIASGAPDDVRDRVSAALLGEIES